ncbi:MAG: CocE/NonD family hydrolase [Actinobacteria bacterium]|nr:CocE/NonD family hydrolase [Actinomycetota bacterium]
MSRVRGVTLRRAGAVSAVVAALLAPGLAAPSAPAQGPHAAQASFVAHGSVEQIYVTGLAPRARMTLLNGSGKAVATKRADPLGGLVFRDVKPGTGYRVRLGSKGAKSGPLTVISTRPAPPSTSVYNQTIQPSGYQYLTTRDGTQLAIYVHPPQDWTKAFNSTAGIPPPTYPSIGQPTPTLIEYSGYGYADPAGPQNGISVIANIMGFTVVDVNMRGTGCSGGAYDFFEPLQNLDGYDVIETIARQPWVQGHKVGMMGISYGGISQLFTAQTRPPSLAAISPLSVIDHTATTLYPGGILNTGFAVAWAKERIHDAKPASSTGGQGWAYQRVQNGDQTCQANQVLHGEAVNLMKKIRQNSHYHPKVVDPLAPVTFVNKINVPTYMACQWTDEQTGGHCATLSEHFTGTQKKWFTFTNGTHVDSLDPQTFNRWYDFLELYVAHQAPGANPNLATVRGAAPVIYDVAMGITGETLPSDPVQNQVTYDGALAAFEQQPMIRVLFDNGAGSKPGYPDPGFEHSWSRFPIPGTTARFWYMARGGRLTDKPSKHAGANKFHWAPLARGLNDFSGDTGSGDLWTNSPTYHWQTPSKRNAVSYLSAPLTQNTTVVGAGAVHVWVKSSRPNVDLQATVTEVRPDGKETFVQNGWIRGNERKLDPNGAIMRHRSTLLEPVPSFRSRDVSPLPRHRYVEVTIPLYYEGHVYRAGSRIRVLITAPNGDQPIWSFSQTQPKKGHATVSIAHSKKMRSSLILPVVPGVAVPTGLPPCPGLRGEPCRTYSRLK